tara:strand:- start:1426 stop:2022 length:597 start_codon:yes stop_codon:yes gene_type:complete
MILDTSGRSHDADRAELLKTSNDLLLKADGFVGAVQMTLSHNGNFSIELTDDAMAADYRTTNNQTTLVVVVPGSEQLFTFNGEFEIVEIMVVNSYDEIPVSNIDAPLSNAPATFNLVDAYPNPFNPTTNISLEILDAGNVSLQIYNIAGQQVADLYQGYMDKGEHSWKWDASMQQSGMYLVKAQTEASVKTQKILLIK